MLIVFTKTRQYIEHLMKCASMNSPRVIRQDQIYVATVLRVQLQRNYFTLILSRATIKARIYYVGHLLRDHLPHLSAKRVRYPLKYELCCKTIEYPRRWQNLSRVPQLGNSPDEHNDF